MQNLVSQNDNGIITTTSLKLAETFGKNHQHILRDIEKLLKQLPKEWGVSNFGQSSYVNLQNKKQPMYTLTRDAFSLLVMGFTGEKALQWKLKYIEAFNAMEKALLDKEIDELKTISDKAYEEGVAVGKDLLSLEVENIAYKKARQRLLEDITTIEEKAFNNGVKHQKKYDGLTQLNKAITYLKKGVTLKDTAKILECSPDTIRDRLKRLGLWEQVKNSNIQFSKNTINQGSLLG